MFAPINNKARLIHSKFVFVNIFYKLNINFIKITNNNKK
jgi:hypothetical protein